MRPSWNHRYPPVLWQKSAQLLSWCTAIDRGRFLGRLQIRLRPILSPQYGAHAATRTEDSRRACCRLNDKVLLLQQTGRGEHASYRPHPSRDIESCGSVDVGSKSRQFEGRRERGG